MWNRDFSELCPSFTLARLNQLEVAVLEVLRVSRSGGCRVDRVEEVMHQVTIFDCQSCWTEKTQAVLHETPPPSPLAPRVFGRISRHRLLGRNRRLHCDDTLI